MHDVGGTVLSAFSQDCVVEPVVLSIVLASVRF